MTGKHDFQVIVWRHGVERDPPDVGWVFEGKLDDFILRDRTLADVTEYMHDYCANRHRAPCFYEVVIADAAE